MIVRLIDFLRDRLKLVIRLCYGVLALLVLYDALLLDKSYAHTAAEKLPGFWSLFGFVACVLIIIVSKWYGHLGIMTREDYYDD
jgi:hypothetical protein